MQLATPYARIAAPAATTVSTDLVSPAKLFGVATSHFRAALTLLDDVDGALAPDSITTLTAANNVMVGMRILHSVLVPNTPRQQRDAALLAIGQAQAGLDLLDGYVGQAREYGEGPIQRVDMQPEALHLLDTARVRIGAAVTRLA